MKRFFKISIITLSLLLLALFAAPFFIDVDHYRTQIEQQVADATGRDFHIGSMQASLFPWVGLTLSDVEMGNADGFSAPTFLTIGHLDVQLAVMPLLQKRFEFRHFSLDAPQVYLQRNTEGLGNWEDLTGSSSISDGASGKSKDQPSAPLLAALIAESITLSKGHLSWQDAQNDQSIQLNNLEVILDDVQQAHPVSLHIGVDVGQEHVSVDGKVGPIGDFSRFQAERLPVQLHIQAPKLALTSIAKSLPELPAILGDKRKANIAVDMNLEQRTDGTRIVTGMLALNAAHQLAVQLNLEQHDAKHLQLQSADLSMDKQLLLHLNGNIELTPDRPNIALRVRSEKLQRTWLTGLLPELGSLYAGHPAPWNDLDFGLLVKANDKRVTLSDMKLHLNQELFTISGVYHLHGAPNLRLNIQADQFHVDPWLPVSKEAPETTANEQQATASEKEPDLRPYADWRISLRAKIGQLYAKGSVLEQFLIDVQEEKGQLRLTPLSFRLAGGQFKEQATANISNYPVTWKESLTIERVRIGSLLKQFANSDQLDGTLDMHSRLHGRGLLPASVKASLGGSGKLSMRDGKVKGFDIAGALRNITSIGKSNGSQYTDFAHLEASFTAKNGILTNNDLFMASPLFRLTGKGTIDLPASAMDYHMQPKLVGTLVGQGDQASARTGVTVPLHIFGPWSSPSIRPELDAGALVGSVQNVLKGQDGHVSQKLKDAGKALTKDPAKAAKEQVNKALGGLLPGF